MPTYKSFNKCNICTMYNKERLQLSKQKLPRT